MSNEKTNRLILNTPEGITFSLLLAGPVTRFLAWLIDAACVSVILLALQTGLALLKVLSLDLAQAVATIGYFVVSIGYGLLCEWGWRGQTLGKKILRLRVVDEQGLKLHFSQVVIRNLLRSVDMLPGFYMVGGVSSLLSSKSQRLGDLMARTVVIRHPEIWEPDFEQLMAGKFNSLRKYPHLCARLRQQVAPGEAAVVLQALLRRDGLAPEARVKLFREVAEHLKAIVVFPEEASEGLSDEQYLRNVADLLYNTGRAKLNKSPG
jgi:uncharacterized RDD family membrane protein YckC